VITNALSYVDIALPTFSDEQLLFGDQDPIATATRIAQAGVREIVVKNGADDALVDVEGTQFWIPAIHVKSPIDTTGAGDSFNGGYLAARIVGEGSIVAGVQAHRVAAATVREHGALAPMNSLRSAKP
jgi:2-dehydro-3-deoxygluconokinase